MWAWVKAWRRGLAAALSLVVLMTGFVLLRGRGAEAANAQSKHAVGSRFAPSTGAGESTAERRSARPLPEQLGETFVLEGLVVGPEGAPAKGATVMLGGAGARTETGPEGLFRFENLERRNYTIWAERGEERSRTATLLAGAEFSRSVLHLEKPGRLRVRVRDARTGAPVVGAEIDLEKHLPAVTETAGVATLALVAGGELTVTVRAPNFAIHRRSVFLPARATDIQTLELALRPGLDLRGMVVSEASSGVPNARVALFDASQVSRGTPLLTTRSADNGNFELHGVASGTYVLTAHAPGTGFGESEQVVIAESTSKAVVITVAGGAELRGVVVDSVGRPVGEAQVRVSAVAGGLVPLFVDTATSSADGSFRVAGLVVGPILVEAEHPSSGSVVLRTSIAGVSEIQLMLKPLNTIGGTIVDSAGHAVSDASIIARRVEDLTGSLGRVGSSDATAHSDAKGQFLLAGLRSGRYVLFAAGPGRSAYGAFGSLRPVTEAHAGDRAVRIVLADDFSISGELVYADGQPVESARIWIDGRGPIALATEAGAFHVADVPAGPRTLTIAAPHATPRDVKVRGQAGAELDLGAITLARGLDVTGTVIDAGGAPVQDAEVMAVRGYVADGSEAASPDTRESPDFATTRSLAGGAFHLRGVSAGSYLLAQHGAKGRSKPVRVVPGQPAQLSLGGLCEMQGTVRRGPVPQARVVVSLLLGGGDGASASDGEASLTLGGISDARGRFSLSSVPPGTYVLATVADGGSGERSFIAERQLEVEGCPRRLERDIVLPEGGATIRAERPEGAGATRELLLWGSASFERAVLSPGATHEFQGLEPGAYELCLRAASADDQSDPSAAEGHSAGGSDTQCRSLTLEGAGVTTVRFRG